MALLAPSASSVADVPMILSFVHQWRQRGGVVHVVYLPHWYWEEHLGSPDLTRWPAPGCTMWHVAMPAPCLSTAKAPDPRFWIDLGGPSPGGVPPDQARHTG